MKTKALIGSHCTSSPRGKTKTPDCPCARDHVRHRTGKQSRTKNRSALKGKTKGRKPKQNKGLVNKGPGKVNEATRAVWPSKQRLAIETDYRWAQIVTSTQQSVSDSGKEATKTDRSGRGVAADIDASSSRLRVSDSGTERSNQSFPYPLRPSKESRR